MEHQLEEQVAFICNIQTHGTQLQVAIAAIYKLYHLSVVCSESIRRRGVYGLNTCYVIRQ